MLSRVGSPARVRAAFHDERFTLITSEPLLTELDDVLTRPRFADKYGIRRADVDELIAIMRSAAAVVPVEGMLRVCRDPDDDIVIETAVAGRANAVVSGDHDVQAAPEIAAYLVPRGILVWTARQFLEALEQQTI